MIPCHGPGILLGWAYSTQNGPGPCSSGAPVLDDWLLNWAFHCCAASLHCAGAQEALPVHTGHFEILCAMDSLRTSEHAFLFTTNISVPSMRLMRLKTPVIE